MTPRYRAWNDALAARFLQEGNDQPLYLYTDEAVLQEVAGEAGADSGAAVDAFGAAIRDSVGGDQPFAAWERRSREGVAAGDVPPYLAVLCFLVLVAVERDNTHFSYYPGLNRALGRPVDAGAPPGFDHHVPLLFTRFNEWLAITTYGAPTASSSPHFPNVGWPLSQALVRPTDRALLVKLFLAAGLRPGKPRTGQWLTAQVLPRLWTTADSPSRTRLLQLAEHHRATFDDLVRKQYDAWDGTDRVQSGPRRSQLRLCYDETAAEWWLLGPAVPGTEGRRWSVGTASGVVRSVKGFEATPAELWSLVGRGQIGSVEAGPSLHSPSRAVRWMSIDTRAGGWAEVAARDDDADQLALVSAGAPSLDVHEGIERREGPPTKLALFFVPRGVRPPGSGTAAAAPEQPVRLEGGLVLHRQTSTYLLCASGLPDLVDVPSGRVSVDGVDVEASGGRARLSVLPLAPGDHVVRDPDGSERRFRLVDRLRTLENRAGAVSWSGCLQAPARVAVPCRTQDAYVWFVGMEGSLAERQVRECRWPQALGLPVTEADVTGPLRSVPFAPRYVVSHDAQGKPWVTRVPDELSNADEDAAPVQYDRGRALALVSALLVEAQPPEVSSDREWRRALAGLMRKVQR